MRRHALLSRFGARAVRWLSLLVAWTQPVGAQEPGRDPTLIDRLDPETRGKVILALAGLVLLGLLMMGLTWLVFRGLRRQFRHTDTLIGKQQRQRREDDWAHKPLADPSGEANEP